MHRAVPVQISADDDRWRRRRPCLPRHALTCAGSQDDRIVASIGEAASDSSRLTPHRRTQMYARSIIPFLTRATSAPRDMADAVAWKVHSMRAGGRCDVLIRFFPIFRGEPAARSPRARRPNPDHHMLTSVCAVSVSVLLTDALFLLSKLTTDPESKNETLSWDKRAVVHGRSHWLSPAAVP